MAAARPSATSILSLSISSPLARRVTTFETPSHSTDAMLRSPRKRPPLRSKSPTNLPTSSPSMNFSGRSARSIIVTATPRFAKIDAYSHAITPPPSTVSDAGR